MTVTAKGRDITVEVNGHKSAHPKNDPGRTKSHIPLQLHGGQGMDVVLREPETRERRT